MAEPAVSQPRAPEDGAALGADKPAPEDDALLLAALDHVWSMAESRRSQRLQVVSYFLVSIAFISAGYVSALGNRLGAVAAAIPVVGIFVALGFWRSDRTLRPFITSAYEPTIALEERLAARLGVPSLELTRWVVDRRRPVNSVGHLISAMYGFSILVFAGAAIYALAR
ncbi:hypothetical protein AB0J82_22545 [Asanoa sp. NPDC049518]|uniref:RipA family octameric membrane protein n=1 Tax=unclassified Asanoa TaxID=2685164 RepID=UPI00342F9675